MEQAGEIRPRKKREPVPHTKTEPYHWPSLHEKNSTTMNNMRIIEK